MEIFSKYKKIFLGVSIFCLLLFAGFEVVNKVCEFRAKRWVAFGGAPELKDDFAEIALITVIRSILVKTKISPPTGYLSNAFERAQLKKLEALKSIDDIDYAHISTVISAPYRQYQLYGPMAKKEIDVSRLLKTMVRAEHNIQTVLSRKAELTNEREMLRNHYILMANELLRRSSVIALNITLANYDYSRTQKFNKLLIEEVTKNDLVIEKSIQAVFPVNKSRLKILQDFSRNNDFYYIYFHEMVAPFPRQIYSLFKYLSFNNRLDAQKLFCSHRLIHSLSFYEDTLEKMRTSKISFNRKGSANKFSRMLQKNKMRITQIETIRKICN